MRPLDEFLNFYWPWHRPKKRQIFQKLKKKKVEKTIRLQALWAFGGLKNF